MNFPLDDRSTMLTLLERWVERGWLRELDLALVRFLDSEVSGMDPALMLAAVLVSHQLGRGHVCQDLEGTLRDPYMVLSLPPEVDLPLEDAPPLRPDELLAGWTCADWIARVQDERLVGDGEGRTPLVRIGHRLYLRRYWRYERQVERAIEDRIARSDRIAASLPGQRFRETLDAVFPRDGEDGTDWQKIACALAARSAFSLITGGPGTGKTTTVVRLLALLQAIALDDGGQPLQIRLAAPTGKAAARLRESITGAIDRLPDFVQSQPALKASIPDEVTTLHRLLGTRPDSRQFRHDARNPLALDMLVIDEGSMIDLEMMAAVLQALPPSARLVLLGDKDQLASVEAGSVLGELCRRAAAGHYRPDTVRWIEQVSGERIDPVFHDTSGRPLDQHVVMLRRSRRFAADSGIGQLALAVNAGAPQQIEAVWATGHADLQRHDLPEVGDHRLTALLLGPREADPPGTKRPQGLAGFLRIVRDERPPLDADQSAFDAWALAVLQAQQRFQLLCALRNGPHGVSGMNQHIETILHRHGLVDRSSAWYEGRPVLITRNDYTLGLMNGDIGVALGHPVGNRQGGGRQWGIRVAFPKTDGSGGVRWVPPSRLPACETVFALTVHKSQGSEFEHCALLLPPRKNPVLTRELIYTGITRARTWLSVICIGHPQIVAETAGRTVQRSGGLFCDEG